MGQLVQQVQRDQVIPTDINDILFSVFVTPTVLRNGKQIWMWILFNSELLTVRFNFIMFIMAQSHSLDPHRCQPPLLPLCYPLRPEKTDKEY